MAKALMIANNPAVQTLASGSAVNLGTALHGFGNCNCQKIISISNGGVALGEGGYYTFMISANVSNSDAGNVTLTVFQDGAATPFVMSETIAAANDPASITLTGAVVVSRCSSSVLTVVATTTAGDAIVNNIAATVTKE